MPETVPSLDVLDADDFPPLTPSYGGTVIRNHRSDESAYDGTAPPLARRLPAPAMPTGADRRHHDWNVQPGDGPVERSSRRGWVIRLSGLVLLIAVAAYATINFPEKTGREIASHIPGVSIAAPD
jgi:hypothetical protein